jgi:hypothetical protein
MAIDTREGSVLLYGADGSRLAEVEVGGAGLGIWWTDFHPDGRYLAAASNGLVKIWDLEDVLSGVGPLPPVRTMPGDRFDISPEGDRLLVRSSGSARVVRWEDGTDVQQVILADTDVGAPVLPAEFSNDGRWLLARTFAGIRRWPADPGRALDLARRHVERFGAGIDHGAYGHLTARGENAGAR